MRSPSQGLVECFELKAVASLVEMAASFKTNIWN